MRENEYLELTDESRDIRMLNKGEPMKWMQILLLMFSLILWAADSGFMSFHQKEDGAYLNVLIVEVKKICFYQINIASAKYQLK